MRNRRLLLLVLIAGAVSLQPALADGMYAGVFESASERQLALDASGVVESVHVAVGDRVEAGDPLLGLNSESERLEVARRQLQRDDRSELQALTRQLEIQNERYRILNDLHAEGRAVSREQVLEAELELIRLRSAFRQAEVREQREAIEVALAEAAYAERQLRSPIAGLIARVEGKSGEWLSTGELAVEVVDPSVLVLRVNVPESVIAGLRKTDRHAITIDGQRRVEGRLDAVAPVADAATGLVELRFTVENPDLVLRPGMEGAVHLE